MVVACFLWEGRRGMVVDPRGWLFVMIFIEVVIVCRFLELERGFNVDALDHSASSSTLCSGQHSCIHVF